MAHRILIVDDEPNIVVPLEFLMKREGYEVAVAARRPGGPRGARGRSAPDLVILDVMLPRMSGFEVCRQHPGRPALARPQDPHADREGAGLEMEKGLGLGADAYVTKPFSTRDSSRGSGAARGSRERPAREPATSEPPGGGDAGARARC